MSLKKPCRKLQSDWTYLGESLHVVSYDLRIWTLELPDDLEALVELGKHVHHRTGEQSMFWCDLEL